MERALEGIGRLKERAAQVGVAGNREYNPGWHTGARPRQPAHRLRGRHPRGASSARRAGAATSATTTRTRIRPYAKFNIVIRKGADGEMQLDARADPGDAGGAQAGHRGAEVDRLGDRGITSTAAVTQRQRPRTPSDVAPRQPRRPAGRRSGSGAATERAGASWTTPPASSRGMVVLDAIHQIQAEQANDLAVRWNCKAGSAARARPR